MGTRHKNLIGKIIAWDNLLKAHHLARRGKRNRADVVEFESCLWENLAALQMEMLWGSYQPGRYRAFMIREPKLREISALPYRDRVVQHAICNICGPIWNNAMIDDTFACRPGKGTHAAADRTQRWLRDMHKSGRDVWILKMDVSKYFQNIRHRHAKKVIRRKISCPKTLKLLDRIIDSTAAENDPDPAGIPVGNLTSQWIANLIGNEFDQWAKREMRIKRYIRYMDDTVVLCWSKHEALELRDRFAHKLECFGMKFSKTSILPAARGVNFVGYRIWHDHRLLRRQSIKDMTKRLRSMQAAYEKGKLSLTSISARIKSWIAHTDHANSYSIRQKLLGETAFSRKEQ